MKPEKTVKKRGETVLPLLPHPLPKALFVIDFHLFSVEKDEQLHFKIMQEGRDTLDNRETTQRQLKNSEFIPLLIHSGVVKVSTCLHIGGMSNK